MLIENFTTAACQARRQQERAPRALLRATAAAAMLASLSSYSQAQTSPAPATAPALAATATLPTVHVSSEYDIDDVRPEGVTTATKTYMAPKDIPQTIDTIEVNKSKTYGINDLSVMLEGVPGVSTSYDMRGDGIMIRGFSADSGDIYRDGVRESGQVRRSTANVERVEILKGPASVLYGRGAGGGVVNLVSKQARFDAKSSINLRGGSWDNMGGTIDINRVLNPNVVVRVTADREQADSFRSGIRNRNEMISPSILVNLHNGLRWTGQYTYDNIWRVPDRGPSFDVLPKGISIRQGFANPSDFVEDKLEVLRSDLSYDINNQWNVRWVASKREASQDFNHFYGGTYCGLNGINSSGAKCTTPGKLSQNYAWQNTSNKTTSNVIDLSGKFTLAGMKHDVLFGAEFSEEIRNPSLRTYNNFGQPIDPFNPVWNTPKPVGDAPTQQNLHTAKSRAFYVQDLISFAPQWTLLLGARHDSYDFSTLNQLNNTTREAKGNSVSPRVGLVWQPVSEHSLYASYSKSYSPYGGRGMLGVSGAQDDEPQYSRQFEVGVKSDWLDNRLSTQLSVYDLEHSNIRYQPDPVNFPQEWQVRGSERSRGIELSASGRVAPHWYVRGGMGYSDPKIIRNKFNPALEGNLLPNVAKYNGSMFVRYATQSPWYGEVGVTKVGGRFTNDANTARTPGYTRWDAMVGWRSAPWTVTAAVTNLLDKTYWRSSAMPGAPRSFLVSANYQF